MQAAESKTVSRDRVVEAFVKWTADRGLAVAPDQARFASDALEEVISFSATLFMNWYLCNQYRYAKMRELSRREIRASVIAFLHELQTGRIAV